MEKEFLQVPLRLINQNDPHLTLCLTTDTWFALLDLADEHGWNPMGTVLPDPWSGFDPDPGDYYFDSQEDRNGDEGGSRLVLIEDALNLADALEEVFMAREPVYVPASFFYFEQLDRTNHSQPSLGALQAAIDFCSLGAFWIEPYRRLP
jgi:hypothetical protein